MRIRVAKIPKRCCQSAIARCPYHNDDPEVMHDWCEHPKLLLKHGLGSISLSHRDDKTGYSLRLPDCPVKGRILTEEG